MVLIITYYKEKNMYHRNNSEQTCTNPEQLHIINTFRRLWDEHVVWTRSFVISSILELPDLQPVTKRLLRNPADFEKALRPFYGNSASKYAQLLTEHLLIAAALVDAAKAHNTNEYNRQRRLWFENAEMIAKFMAAVNPYWKQNEWRDMMFEHLELLETEVVQILSHEYEKGVAQFDLVQAQALEMGDMMAEGIIRQFRI